MDLKLWTAVDQYLAEAFVPAEPTMEAALRASIAAGLPAINVSPTQGMLLKLLAQLQGARRILEIGTLGGYSTLWLAAGLAGGGRIITLEFDPKHAAIAQRNFADAGMADRIELRLGQAVDLLHALVLENVEPFDLIFIDADKANIPAYFEASLMLARPGTLIIVDNIVRDGKVIDAASTDPAIVGVRTFIQQLSAETRVTATALQTVGSKGYDGFALVRVNDSGIHR